MAIVDKNTGEVLAISAEELFEEHIIDENLMFATHECFIGWMDKRHYRNEPIDCDVVSKDRFLRLEDLKDYHEDGYSQRIVLYDHDGKEDATIEIDGVRMKKGLKKTWDKEGWPPGKVHVDIYVVVRKAEKMKMK